MKVLVAVPTYENISPDTFRSIYALESGGHDLTFDFVRGYDVARARIKIAQAAMASEADYVLMIDNDVAVPPDALVHLIEGTPNVCLGYYAHRGFENRYDGRTNLCKYDGEKDYTHQYTASELNQLRDEGFYRIRVHGGGLGCALIRTEMFRRIRFPWFQFTTYPDGRVLGEDLYFCELVNNSGMAVHGDVRVGCGHLFRRMVYCE